VNSFRRIEDKAFANDLLRLSITQRKSHVFFESEKNAKFVFASLHFASDSASIFEQFTGMTAGRLNVEE